jgi:hypothetical protein
MINDFPHGLLSRWVFMVPLGMALISSLSTPVFAESEGFLETINRNQFLTPTNVETGDGNPYAVVVAPVSIGSIEKDDVLVDNFNDVANLQGKGTSIIRYRPGTKESKLFAKVSQKLKECPGGVGLTTAMTMLKAGWIIVGSLPSTDGSTRTKGDGCLLVFDAQGRHVATWAGPNINGPWGNMATIDKGDKATLFISMAGFGVPSFDVIDPQTQYPVIVNKSTVLRLELSIPKGQPPVIERETVIGNGFSQRADMSNFLFGPTGLALGADDTLYVTDGLDNEITAISNASTRIDSSGKGRLVTKDGLLAWPLAMIMTDEGHLIVNNGKNGQVVEVDPVAGKQLYAYWANANQAQSPPGNGNLFGLAWAPDKKGFYFVADDINALWIATP